MQIDLKQGDCLERMKEIPDGSVDMVLTDPPYGTTACKWDSVIPLEPMWEHLRRVIKLNGAILLFCSQPFTTNLIQSNLKQFKYCWVWKKTKAVGFQHAKNKPMKILEDIAVFSQSPVGHKSQIGNRRMKYNPQGITCVGEKVVSDKWHGNMMGARPNQVGRKYRAFTGYPNEILEFKQPIGKQSIHPTQKPVALMEYLIKTYTNEGETVLDFTMGSGTTGVACVNTDRNFVGIELDKEYFELSQNRIQGALDGQGTSQTGN